MDIVKVNWSGGKDSTAALLLHIKRGDFVKAVCFVPMLTNDIPLIMPNHYEFIMNTKTRFESMGAMVKIVHGISYKDFTHHYITKGKNRGKRRGIGLGLGFCVFRDSSKIKSLENCDVGYFDYLDIGIASDEINRINQLNSKKKSILYELGITEIQAKKICTENGLLSPHYKTHSRDGCAICPNAAYHTIIEYVRAYPKAKEILLEIEKESELYYPNRTPYRNHERFSDRII